MIHLFPTDIQSIIFSYLSRDDYVSFVMAYKGDIKRCLKGIHFDFDQLLSKLNSQYYYRVIFNHDPGLVPDPREDVADYHDLSDAINCLLNCLLNHFRNRWWPEGWNEEDNFDYFCEVLIMILDNHQIKYDYILNRYDIPPKLLKSNRDSGPMEDISHEYLDQVLPDLINLCQGVLENDYLDIYHRLENKNEDINFILHLDWRVLSHDHPRFTFTKSMPYGEYYSIKKYHIN